jgi:hypothetical protein
MIVAGSASPLLLSSAGGYNLTNSLRFRSSASAYLSRTSVASPTNNKIFTISKWIKRGIIGDSTFDSLFGGASSQQDSLGFGSGTNNAGDSIQLRDANVGSYNILTTQVFRDPSAWYHLVVAIDTTQATASDRVKIYINGTQVTSFTTASYPSQNYVFEWNAGSTASVIGRRSSGNALWYFDGYLDEVNFIDGQALTPSSFGATSATTGVWQPIRYAGTYGTNGFFLPFTDNSALTTSSNVGLGRDYSGNGNYWTTNNISITAGVTYDSMTDVPTLTSATTANYATYNPLLFSSASGFRTLSNGNLTTVGNSASNNGNDYSTQTVTTGKWYAEFTCSGSSGIYPQVGIISVANAGSGGGQVGYTANSFAYFADGTKQSNGSSSAYGSSFTTNDVIGVAVDADNGAIYFSKNGVFQNSGVPTSGASRTGAAYTWTGGSIEFYFSTAVYQSTNGWSANFGQRPLSATPPTGFNRLNTFNLPTPTIGATASTQAGDNFGVSLWTGTGSNQTISGVGFQPDFIWAKGRNNANDNVLFDSVRGFNSNKPLYSNQTWTEGQFQFGDIKSVNSDGYVVGAGASGDNYINFNTYTYVGWAWKANGTPAVTNTAGTITSTISANTSAGFSVVTYTGTGVTGTIGHGLGVAPAMIIVKSRSNSSNWYAYHQSIGNTGAVGLNLTSATITSANFWNNTSPTSSVFTASAGSAEINGNGLTYVAYCFSQIAGYSAFGSYTGNGSADGPFVFTGFRPRYVLIKGSSLISEWYVWDSVRNPSNVANLTLNPNQAAAEYSGGALLLDLTSNGFKIRDTVGSWNANGNTYIYMAFAESPFKYANAR